MVVELPPLSPVDLPAAGPVAAFHRAMVPVCPFIEPAARAGLLLACDAAIDCQEAADVHPRMFEQLVPLVERFRAARRAETVPSRRLLVCHTAVLSVPAHLDADVVRLLNWPNLLGWSLKQLYTPKEVVLGFVRRGVAERGAGGITIPVAPFHAVIIRSRVAGSDGRFFPNNPELLAALRAADDDGGDVFTPTIGPVPDPSDPAALRADQTYARVLRWLATSVAKR